MKVYLLGAWDYDSHRVIGIYMDRSSGAREAKRLQRQQYQDRKVYKAWEARAQAYYQEIGGYFAIKKYKSAERAPSYPTGYIYYVKDYDLLP